MYTHKRGTRRFETDSFRCRGSENEYFPRRSRVEQVSRGGSKSFFRRSIENNRPVILWLEIRRACARQEGNKEIKNLVTGTPGRGKKAFRTRSRDIAPYRFPLPSLEYTTNSARINSSPSFTLVCAKVFPLCAQHNLFHPV